MARPSSDVICVLKYVVYHVTKEIHLLTWCPLHVAMVTNRCGYKRSNI